VLRELQRDLSAAFRERDVEGAATRRVLAALRPMGRVDAARGIEVYRGALRHVVEDALREILPVCVELVGERCFRTIARLHAERHRSEHPDLGRIADDVPEWLPGLSFLASVPYLADVARLELALHRAADAPDPPPVAQPERMADALASEPDRWRFRLPPSATLIESPHPVHAIWAAHRDSGADADRWPIEQGSEPDRLIVWRSPGGPCVEPIEAGLWPLLVAIDAGASVAMLLRSGERAGTQSLAEVLEDDAANHEPVLAAVGLLFARGWVAGIEPVAHRPAEAGVAPEPDRPGSQSRTGPRRPAIPTEPKRGGGARP
jgi:hypothetical protein